MTSKRGRRQAEVEEDEALPREDHPDKRAKPRVSEPQAFENGVVLSITVENFMNHRHLKVDLSPGVNFVVGKNGSGKSAIVMALQAGLGCKASASGRNSNTYKNNIMNGCDTANIKITLANGGTDPFKFEEFGDSITVEHRLERHGAGSYHLSNENKGVRRRSSRGEVEDLCRHFNIQAANPCAVLTQEHAKKFLHNGNESSLYEFFLEAANLKIIQDELRGAKAALETTDQQIEAFETKMPEYEEAAARAKAEYDGAIALKKLDSDREELERLLVWSCFNDRVRQIEENKEALQTARRSLSEIGEEQRALNEKQNSIQAEQSAASREKDDLFKQLEDVSKLGKGLKERSSKEKKEIKQAERALLAVTEDIELSKKNHEQAQLRLERQLATLEADQKAQQAELARQRTELDGEAAMLGDKISQAQRKADAIQLEHDGVVKEAEGLQREVSEADSRCRNVSEALKQIDREGFQAITRLHPRMPELMRLIQSNGGAFQCQPVGPLGLFVKVTPGNEQYAKGAEMALGGPRGLSTFVVREVHDENKLYQLAQSVGLKQYIRIVRRQPDRRFEVRERHPVTSRLNPHLTAFKTVFDVISVSDDTVFNVLIDLYNIEARLLIPTEAEATQALFKTPLSFGSNTRDRVGQLQGVVLESGASFSKKAAGLEGRVAASVQPQGVLQSDIEHAKRDLQAELQRCKAQHTEAITALQGVMVRVKALASSQVSERRDIKTLTQALRQTHVKMRQLEGETQIDPAEEVVNELREEVKTWCERIVAEQHKEVQLSAQLEALRATQAMKGDGLAEAMTRYTNLKAMYEQKQAETEQFVGPLNQCKVQMRRLEKQLHEANVAKEAAKKTIKDLEATNARDLPTLKENYGERVADPAGRSLEELNTEMQNLRRRVTKAEKKHGGKNLYELEQQANITTSKMLEKKEELLIVTKSREGTLAAFEERYRFWQRSCKHKGKQANLDFNGRLTRKGHAGELRFDHRSQMLSLQVNRNNQDAKSSGTTDARNLSGGERSFTTLAFELSMWEFCETPFRVLDEFDVFMDDTYRTIAVHTLLELCEKQPHRQFIFLTPQDMHPFLKDYKDQPRVIKMSDVR